jgi:hypothetical protein
MKPDNPATERACSAETASLDGLTREDLLAEYARCYGRPAPAYAHPKLLRLAIAHRHQEAAVGGSDPTLSRCLRRLAEELQTTGQLPAPTRPPVKPGTRLLREWKGETHTVTVEEAGFRYRDQHYRSLSAVAREITGSRWSGPVFFGLKNAEGRQ